jgi:16S rRNA (uracil1498-N3)-methyltransferase
VVNLKVCAPMKMITNFYVNPENVGKDSLKIVGEEAKHIITVLRYQKGESIDVVDGCGVKYKVVIQDWGKDYVEGKILLKTRKENEPITHLTLAQAICKGVRMNFLIEKATEIGVSAIIPILTEKSLVKINKISEEDGWDSFGFVPFGLSPQGRKQGKSLTANGKTERWRRLAIAGMKQSLRSILPDIQHPTKFDDLLPKIKTFDLSFIASLEKGAKSLKECDELKNRLINRKKSLRHVLIMVGPEAGFTEEELSKAKAFGVIPVTLGSRRLRTETAGVVLSSLILYELEDLG